MKNSSLLFIAIMIFCSCEDESLLEPQVNIIGSWKLIQTYNDPGDGSGDFENVNSEKEVTFLSNGTFTSNGEHVLQ